MDFLGATAWRRMWEPTAALLVANVRYWPRIAPLVREELSSWEAPARCIGDRCLRRLALAKLREERFNAEVAATLATLSPPSARAAAVRAIVAFELLFDYLDGRTEIELTDPIQDGLQLFAPFTSAVAPPQDLARTVPPAAPVVETPPDGAYRAALGAATHESLYSLSSANAVAPFAHAAARRCAEAQTRLHASPQLGDHMLEEWARERAAGSGLAWREYLAGCASSVLSVHALIAAAADRRTSSEDADRIDRAYLAIGGVITILDSLVDHATDIRRGELGFNRFFASERELHESLRTLIHLALARAQEAPRGDHHAMTLVGIAAFYTTHPGARERNARALVSLVRHELAPTIWPAVAVMRAWRVTKTVRSSMSCA